MTPRATPRWTLTLTLLCAACAPDAAAPTPPDLAADADPDDLEDLPAPPEDTTQPDAPAPDLPPDDAPAPDLTPDPDEAMADLTPDLTPEDVTEDAADLPPAPATATWEALGERVTVRVDDAAAPLRRYALSTTATLRDQRPEGGQESFSEDPARPRLRSGDLLFDALFALAVEEARRDSVTAISDGAFNRGQGVPCDCFETGERWNYVWTRDTAYAVDLGLAWLDSPRCARSLDFKLSAPKGGGALQIVQDTGSGGSWPVSTDRVAWALGARAALLHLPDALRAPFAARALEALQTTLDIDRGAVFDPRDGLYRGEQSFLDWREQSYPSWTAQDTVHIGAARSLSTNVTHLAALRLAADLHRARGDAADAALRDAQADALRDAIRAAFWDPDRALLLGLRGPALDPGPIHRLDLLGASLAVLHGVLSPQEARDLFDQWPHAPLGTAVQWPQQPLTPIYHNRAIWPFVSAYAALAARRADHPQTFDHQLDSLARGAALNLSHLENFELLTQQPWLDDGPFSGPVVNSRRQLWSVAGYLGLLLHGVFGLDATPDGLRLQPYVTTHLRNTWLSATDAPRLEGLRWRGRALSVALRLPPVGVTGGALAVEALEVNGQPWPLDMPLPDSALPDGAEVVVTLGPGDPAPLAPLRIVQDTSDFRALFAPREPRLDAVERDGDRLRLRFDANGEAGVVFHIWRDGQQVAEALTDTTWRDPDSGDFLNNSYCYSVEAEFPTTGHRSHRSPPRCDWGEERIQDLSAYTFQATGGRWSTTHGRGHFEDWGDAGHAIEVYGFRPRWTGTYLIQPRYGNGSGPVNTGITAGVKVLSVRDLTDDREVARGQVMMPHLGAWDRWAEGSTLEVALDATRRYALRVEDGANMSSLSHFVSYTGGAGGGEGTWNRVNLSGLRLLPLRGQDSGRLRGDAVSLGTADDLASFPPAQRLAPGAPRSPRSAAAITWDQDFLYVALSTESFDDPWRPLQLYLEASEGPLAPPSPSQGQEYSGLRPWLPFTPTHLVSLRPQPGAPGEAPWSAIWRPRGQAWSQLWRLEPGQSLWWSPAAGVIAARVPLAPLGDVRHLRLSAHVVHAQPGQEWKDTLPDTHTPWAASTSGYYELDLQGPTPSDQWSTR